VATDPGIRRLALKTLLAAFPGTAPPEEARQLVADGLAGYTLFARNIAGREQLARLTADLRAVRSDVLIAIDEEGGDVTRLAHATGSPYPGNAALGVVGDPVLTRRVYRAIGTELAAVGVNLNLAPTVDVNSVDDNPIIGTRSFGADPAVVAAHASAAVVGLQAARVAACAKHFPGHGATLEDSHLRLPTVDASLAVLRSRDLPPFAAVVGVDAKAVMTAHIRVPELTGDQPATFSEAALNLLRDGFGFTGVIVSDALEMASAAVTAGGIGPAAVRALRAGADLLCLGADVDAALCERVAGAIAAAVAGGALPVGRLEQAVDRTSALAAWTLGEARDDARDDARAESVPPDLGYRAARRAIRTEGTVDGLAGALVVQLESGSSIAEGPVPWGLRPHLPDGTVVSVEATRTSVEELAERAQGRPLVVVGRHLHRSAVDRALVEKLVADHPCVVVEMGWPSTWRPAGARGFVMTYGASLATGAALADTLHLR
jgi:beta-N-acetylhexosaminidase